MTWYVQKNAESVVIYDRLDADGDGNVRFRGTHDAALTHFAGLMQTCDEQRAKIAELEAEIVRLKTQLTR